MKKVILGGLIVLLLLTGCGSSNNGELTGVLGRKKFFEPEPFEMAFIPAGSFVMGPSDQDAFFAQNAMSKTVTVEAFWMDQTEISNNKYRQFVYYVRDSILRTKLGNAGIEGREYFVTDKEGNAVEPNIINWEEKIDPEEENTLAIIEEMYYPPEERFNGRKRSIQENLIIHTSGLTTNRQLQFPTNRITKQVPVNMTGRQQTLKVFVQQLQTVQLSFSTISSMFIPILSAG